MLKFRQYLSAGILERFALWCSYAVVAEILVVGFFKAKYKFIWLDELMGLYIAKLPSVADIIGICKAGADNQPIFFHLAMRTSVRLLGSDALGLRLPAVIAFAVFSFCLYWFVSQKASRWYGVMAMLLPGITGCWYYATEGRPYSLVLGCAGVAAVSWQALASNRRRPLLVLSLFLSLALAVNFHYFAVLLPIPFIMAEGTRTYLRRKPDAAVWAAILIPLLLPMIYLPIIRVSKVNSGIPYAPFARAAVYPGLLRFAGEFFIPCILPLVFLGALYLGFRVLHDKLPTVPEEPMSLWIPDTVLVLGFCCVPVFATLLARFGTHILFSRYAMAGLVGFSALLGMASCLAFHNRRWPAVVFCSVLGAMTLYRIVKEDLPVIQEARHTPLQVSIPKRLHVAERQDLPIVLTNLDEYMQYYYYGDEALRRRIVYVASEKFAEKYLGFTIAERMMESSAPYFKTQVIDFPQFLASHREFYVFGDIRYPQWVIPELLAEGVDLQLVQGGPSDIFGGVAEECLLATVK